MNTELLFALALYLTTRAGERLAREDLVDRFWVAGTLDKRRHALRQLLYRLRQKGLTLDEDGGMVYLDPSQVDSDLRDALSDDWSERAGAMAIDTAAEFAPRFNRRTAPSFREWLDGILSRLESQHRKASLLQVSLSRREGRWADLERWAMSVLRTDPLNEAATLARAEGAAMAGSKAVALEILDSYLQEIGDISPELGRSAAQLRKRIGERRPDWVLRGPKEVPLVGRSALMTRLTTLVDATWRGAGGAIVLVGPPGIGKTRLAMETRAYAELNGLRTIVLRAEKAGVERPLAVIHELIEALLELPGVPGCDPESLLLLRRLVARGGDPSRRTATAFMVSVRESLPDAIQDLIDAVTHECRILVIIDDYHHVDEPSLAILRGLAQASDRRRAAWIASARSGHEFTRLRPYVDGHLSVVRVDGLAAGDARLLAAATSAAHAIELSEASVASVATASAGNPLFVRELSYSRGRWPASMTLPQSLSSLISERIGTLPATQLRILRLVSLLGSDATAARLRAITRLESAELTQVVESLELDGLLHATDARTFSVHECWQQALLESMLSATRISLSHECALGLVDEATHDLNPHKLWRAAELFSDAGALTRAFELYGLAAERLYAAGYPAEAVAVLERARTLAPQYADDPYVLCLIAQCQMAAGNPEGVLEPSMAALARRGHRTSANSDELTACLCTRTDALSRLGMNLEPELKALVRICSDDSLSSTARQLACLTGLRTSVNQALTSETEHFFEQSRAVIAQHGYCTLGALTGILYFTEMGPIDALSSANAHLSALELTEPSLYWRCTSMRFRCQSLRIQGHQQAASALGEQTFALAKSHSLYQDAHLALELLTFMSLDRNSLEEAQHWLDNMSALNGRTRDLERIVALGHARDRYEMQSGNFGQIAERLLGRFDGIQSDRRVGNQSAELSTLAFCLAGAGRISEALEIVPVALHALAPIRGRFTGDYPVELVARTLRLAGNPKAADHLTFNHVIESRQKYSRPIPEFFEELSRAAAGLTNHPH